MYIYCYQDFPGYDWWVELYTPLSSISIKFIFISESIGGHGAFWLFGVVCVIALFFVIVYVPETQGKTLEDIERKMMGRVRRMSSVANIKPLSFNM